jgi:hypothetical protein
MTNKTNLPYIDMVIKGSYEDFTDFYDVNKKPIYENIVEIFKGFKTTKKRILTLYIQAKIQGLEWDTEFKFNRRETVVLMRDVLPFFESIEDYEKCIEIKNLYELLTNKKETHIIDKVS